MSTISLPQQLPAVGALFVPPPLPDDNYDTYFLAWPVVNMVKIGKSTKPAWRMANLMQGMPGRGDAWGVIHPGNHEEEYHKRFADARGDGEWFHPTPELIEFMFSKGKAFSRMSHICLVAKDEPWRQA